MEKFIRANVTIIRCRNRVYIFALAFIFSNSYKTNIRVKPSYSVRPEMFYACFMYTYVFFFKRRSGRGKWEGEEGIFLCTKVPPARRGSNDKDDISLIIAIYRAHMSFVCTRKG